mmetsp:Transcript_7462/g.13359  ORF Transcript_7462/g.13359 Transcript_7462/m.13359 type:complete len:452 (+) Transcript_7462:37-1392(+)
MAKKARAAKAKPDQGVWRPKTTTTADSPFAAVQLDKKSPFSSAPSNPGSSVFGTAKQTIANEIPDSYIPPGCDVEEDDENSAPSVVTFEEILQQGYWCPPRLIGRNNSLVEAVNDWHFAMLNDSHRNEFFWKSMIGVVEGKKVIDIGAGSGLLSMMAARLGASEVLAIEASGDMVELARKNIEVNGFGMSDKIKVVHNMSNKVVLAEEEKADVIVSETLGTVMLGEGILDFMSDARRRLAKPNARVIPSQGSQYAMLVSSASLETISSFRKGRCIGDFDLTAIGVLQDTANLFFTKQWGFRLSTIQDLVQMSDRICILNVDFHKTERNHLSQVKEFRLTARSSGVIHAVVASWEVSSEDGAGNHLNMSTHHEDTKDPPWGFARDIQWGQGLQLVEDADLSTCQDRYSQPEPFTVEEGEELILTVRFQQPTRQTCQFQLRRASRTCKGASSG